MTRSTAQNPAARAKYSQRSSRSRVKKPGSSFQPSGSVAAVKRAPSASLWKLQSAPRQSPSILPTADVSSPPTSAAPTTRSRVSIWLRTYQVRSAASATLKTVTQAERKTSG